MTTAAVIDLDSRRPRATEQLVCLFCHAKGSARVISGQKYYPCPGDPGCDEVASVPAWRLEMQ